MRNRWRSSQSPRPPPRVSTAPHPIVGLPDRWHRLRTAEEVAKAKEEYAIKMAMVRAEAGGTVARLKEAHAKAVQTAFLEAVEAARKRDEEAEAAHEMVITELKGEVREAKVEAAKAVKETEAAIENAKKEVRLQRLTHNEIVFALKAERVRRDREINKLRHQLNMPTGAGKMIVHLHNAKGLRVSDSNGLSDPYIRLILGGSTQRSKVAEDTLDPTYDVSFSFPFNGIDAAIRETLTLEAWDQDRGFLGGADDKLGSGKLLLESHRLALERGEKVECIVPLEYAPTLGFSGDRILEAGEVYVTISWEKRSGLVSTAIGGTSRRLSTAIGGTSRRLSLSPGEPRRGSLVTSDSSRRGSLWGSPMETLGMAGSSSPERAETPTRLLDTRLTHSGRISPPGQARRRRTVA